MKLDDKLAVSHKWTMPASSTEVAEPSSPPPAPLPKVEFASRFHRAAIDGLQKVAVEASSRESNTRDQEGLTPTLWSAFCGHIDVLRAFVGRGGIPGKYDRLGNTGLHLAAAGGHTKCVAFLISMGEDVWALNIDGRTPRDLAAACPEGEVALRMLDAAMSRENTLDPKKVLAKKERAKHRAEKLLAEFRRSHAKNKRFEEEEWRSIMERSQNVFGSDQDGMPPRRHSEASLASSTATGATSGSLWSMVRLQALQRGRRASNNSKVSNTSNASSAFSTTSMGTQLRHFQFKVGTVSSDGSRVARPLPGIAPSTEVLYVREANNPSSRRTSLMSTGSAIPLDSVTDAFELAQQTRQESLVVVEPPADSDSDEDPSEVYYQSRHRTSIFDRPGFGTFAFRHSLTGLEITSDTLLGDNEQPTNWSFKKQDASDVPDGHSDDISEVEEDLAEDVERSPLQAFLVAWDLPQLAYQLVPVFRGDLDALLSVAEEDLRLAGIPMGPRKKLLRAIELHNEALQSPSLEDAETKL